MDNPTSMIPRSDTPSDLSGTTLGDFRLQRRLGQGGMGQVYLAEQVSLKRKVAVKVMRGDLSASERSSACSATWLVTSRRPIPCRCATPWRREWRWAPSCSSTNGSGTPSDSSTTSAFTMLGQVGQGIVLSIQGKSKESNDMFRKVQKSILPGPFGKPMWAVFYNPHLKPYILQALERNSPSDAFSPELQEIRRTLNDMK